MVNSNEKGQTAELIPPSLSSNPGSSQKRKRENSTFNDSRARKRSKKDNDELGAQEKKDSKDPKKSVQMGKNRKSDVCKGCKKPFQRILRHLSNKTTKCEDAYSLEELRAFEDYCKKRELKFAIDCRHPVEDGFMNCTDFETYFNERFVSSFPPKIAILALLVHFLISG